MTTSQKPIEDTCRYVASSNELASLATDVLITSILAHARQLRPGAVVARLPVDEAVGRAVHDADTARAGLEAVSAAMEQLPRAHAQVLHSLDDPVAPLDALEQLVAEATRAKDVYDELQE